MRIGRLALAMSVPLWAGCAAHELVRADDMSAAQHRSEAEREDQAAAQSASRYQPSAAQSRSTGDDPNEDYRREVERRREHARQHESAAAFLEHFEDQECRHVPVASRAACPLLGPVTRIDDVPGGLRATFADARRAETALAEMRCHYAYARSHHFDAAAGCPLYVRGIEIRLAIDPRAIEVVSRDERTERLIRERGRQEAVFSRHAAR